MTIVELLRSHQAIADADALKAADEIERLRAALTTAAQWMPSPGAEYDDDAKADVRQVQEALGWIPK